MTLVQVRLKPYPVTHHTYLHAFVSLLQGDVLFLLQLKAGSFWYAGLCGRWLGRGWKFDGSPETRKGYLVASSGRVMLSSASNGLQIHEDF